MANALDFFTVQIDKWFYRMNIFQRPTLVDSLPVFRSLPGMIPLLILVDLHEMMNPSDSLFLWTVNCLSHNSLVFCLYGLWFRSISHNSFQSYVMPGISFPTVGRLDITSPPFRQMTFSLASVLWSAKTTNNPSRVRSLFAILPRYLVCSSLFVFSISGSLSGWSFLSQCQGFYHRTVSPNQTCTRR